MGGVYKERETSWLFVQLQTQKQTYLSTPNSVLSTPNKMPSSYVTLLYLVADFNMDYYLKNYMPVAEKT